jgi:hypothetical protein
MSEQLPKDTLSSTPRTDAVASDGWSGDAVAVPVVVARQIERELIEARRALRREENARLIAVKDADRYRWLRHGDNDELVLRHYIRGSIETTYLPRNEALDAAIDAAMGKQS